MAGWTDPGQGDGRAPLHHLASAYCHISAARVNMQTGQVDADELSRLFTLVQALGVEVPPPQEVQINTSAAQAGCRSPPAPPSLAAATQVAQVLPAQPTEELTSHIEGICFWLQVRASTLTIRITDRIPWQLPR